MDDRADQQAAHQPVLLREVLGFLEPERGGVFVDCTVGEGGHARAILQAGGPDTRLVGIDRDGEILEIARKRLEPFSGRFQLVHDNFSNLKEVLKSLNIDQVTGILLDLGISLYHLTRPDRGFSFMHEGPLDMRLDRDEETSAADLVNGLREEELAEILKEYGEERWARRIARSIVWVRAREPITTTTRFADVVRRAIPAKYRPRKINPATRSFQALRIAVNRELDILPGAIREAVDVLGPGGTACFIAFHSLEDRQVKRTLRAMERGCADSFEKNASDAGRGAKVKLLTPKPITPSPEERVSNPHSRSSKLRVARKI